VDLAYGGSALALALVAAWAALHSFAPRLRWPIALPPIRVMRMALAGHGGATIVWPTPKTLPASAPPATTPPQAAPHDAEPPSLFDRFPWLYAFCREWLFRDHTDRIAAALWPEGAPRPGSALLELGCGPGFYSRRFATRFAQLRVTGIDRSTEQLRHARTRAQAGSIANCRFVQGDVRALAQPADTADAVVASRLFTILPEREQALAEMHRVLRPDGRCFIAEPRSRLWTALPLRALWLLANVARLIGRAPATYREPARATVLETSEFADLLNSQPWAEVRQWHDCCYHYAVCRKATRTPEILAAD